jgi:hypothetical protein
MGSGTNTTSDDPRKLRELIARSLQLAADHGLPSVIVGLAGHEDDLLVPELLSYVESSLRVEDAIFHLTRERAVVFLADVGSARAHEIVERFVCEFRREFARAQHEPVRVGYFELEPRERPVFVKDVLPALFPAGGAAESV